MKNKKLLIIISIIFVIIVSTTIFFITINNNKNTPKDNIKEISFFEDINEDKSSKIEPISSEYAAKPLDVSKYWNKARICKTNYGITINSDCAVGKEYTIKLEGKPLQLKVYGILTSSDNTKDYYISYIDNGKSKLYSIISDKYYSTVINGTNNQVIKVLDNTSQLIDSEGNISDPNKLEIYGIVIADSVYDKYYSYSDNKELYIASQIQPAYPYLILDHYSDVWIANPIKSEIYMKLSGGSISYYKDRIYNYNNYLLNNKFDVILDDVIEYTRYSFNNRIYYVILRKNNIIELYDGTGMLLKRSKKIKNIFGISNEYIVYQDNDNIFIYDIIGSSNTNTGIKVNENDEYLGFYYDFQVFSLYFKTNRYNTYEEFDEEFSKHKYEFKSDYARDSKNLYSAKEKVLGYEYNTFSQETTTISLDHIYGYYSYGKKPSKEVSSSKLIKDSDSLSKMYSDPIPFYNPKADYSYTPDPGDDEDEEYEYDCGDDCGPGDIVNSLDPEVGKTIEAKKDKYSYKYKRKKKNKPLTIDYFKIGNKDISSSLHGDYLYIKEYKDILLIGVISDTPEEEHTGIIFNDYSYELFIYDYNGNLLYHPTPRIDRKHDYLAIEIFSDYYDEEKGVFSIHYYANRLYDFDDNDHSAYIIQKELGFPIKDVSKVNDNIDSDKLKKVCDTLDKYRHEENEYYVEVKIENGKVSEETKTDVHEWNDRWYYDDVSCDYEK